MTRGLCGKRAESAGPAIVETMRALLVLDKADRNPEGPSEWITEMAFKVVRLVAAEAPAHQFRAVAGLVRKYAKAIDKTREVRKLEKSIEERSYNLSRAIDEGLLPRKPAPTVQQALEQGKELLIVNGKPTLVGGDLSERRTGRRPRR